MKNLIRIFLFALCLALLIGAFPAMAAAEPSFAGSGTVFGGTFGTGGIAGVIDCSFAEDTHLDLELSLCRNTAPIRMAGLLSRGGGLAGEVDVTTASVLVFSGCVNEGDIIPGEEMIKGSDQWYSWSCVLGGMVGAISDNSLRFNPADARDAGELSCTFTDCSNTGKLVTYENNGVTYYTGDLCGLSAFTLNPAP